MSCEGYIAETQVAVGSGSEFGLDFFRQVVMEGLLLLAGDNDRLMSLYARSDTMALNDADSAEAAAIEDANTLRRLAKFGSRSQSEGVNIYSSVPDHQRQPPFIGFRWEGSITEQAAAVGDTMSALWKQVDGKMYLDVATGSFKRGTVRTSVLCTTYDETRVLYQAVASTIEYYRARFDAVGAHDIVISRTPPMVDETLISQEQFDARLVEGTIHVRVTWLERTLRRKGPYPTRVFYTVTGEAPDA